MVEEVEVALVAAMKESVAAWNIARRARSAKGNKPSVTNHSSGIRECFLDLKIEIEIL